MISTVRFFVSSFSPKPNSPNIPVANGIGSKCFSSEFIFVAILKRFTEQDKASRGHTSSISSNPQPFLSGQQ